MRGFAYDENLGGDAVSVAKAVAATHGLLKQHEDPFGLPQNAPAWSAEYRSSLAGAMVMVLGVMWAANAVMESRTATAEDKARVLDLARQRCASLGKTLSLSSYECQ